MTFTNNNKTFTFYKSIAEIAQTWNSLVPSDNYFSVDFLETIEVCGPNNLQPFYCLIQENNRYTGIVYLQIKKVNLGESIRKIEEKGIVPFLKKIILPYLSADTLVVGNLLLTGNYGFVLNQYDYNTQLDIVDKAVAFSSAYTKATFNKNPGPILYKDYFVEAIKDARPFATAHRFEVQPNMIMDIDPRWSAMSDYEDALKSKSRIRYKRARSKFEPIVSSEMTLADVQLHEDRMYELYLNISNNAGFNLFVLNKNYFQELKKRFTDKFIITGYYIDQTLVGFSTVMHNYDHLDAHFLGYDGTYNAETQLYLNMLFDMIALGIDLKVQKICMSRTAMEIKSSVGALGYDMSCYLSHKNKYINKYVPRIVKNLNEVEEWEKRNPFK